MKSKEVISIIIPVKNRHDLFLKCLNSVRRQKFNPFENEIIVIDDDSKPSISSYLKKHGNWKGIKIIRNPRSLGPGSARNKGIKLAKGKVVAFLDADDLWRSDYLFSIGKKLDLEKSEMVVSLVKTNIYTKFVLKTEVAVKLINFLRNLGIALNDIFQGNLAYEYFYLMHLSSTVFTKKAYKGVRFDSTFKNGEDWKFFLDSIQKNKPKIKIIERTMVELNYDTNGNTFKRPHFWKDYYRLIRAVPSDLRKRFGIFLFKKYTDFSSGMIFK